jgi:hypothetical protein
MINMGMRQKNRLDTLEFGRGPGEPQRAGVHSQNIINK